MNRLLAPELTAEKLDCAVRDNLVRVHVALGATASLEDNEREMVDELPGDDLHNIPNIRELVTRVVEK